MLIQTEFDIFKKITLKRLRPVLKNLDIKVDFVELSTSYMGKGYEVRVMGLQDLNGMYSWDIVRVVNRSIVPSDLDYNILDNKRAQG
jgi:hypothetical protein